MANRKDDSNPVVWILLLLLLGVAGYFGWTYLKSHPGGGATPQPSPIGDETSASDTASDTASDDTSAASVASLTPDEAAAASAAAQGFTYLPAQTYRPATWPTPAAFPNAPAAARVPTGHGYVGELNWAPDMCFPIESTPDFANSQVYGPGGGGNTHASVSYPVAGAQSNIVNYSYPWVDNFCEVRDWNTPACHGGHGHQGQDIRPGSPDGNNQAKTDTYWAVSTEKLAYVDYDGVTLRLKGVGSPSRRYNYLHLQPSSILPAVYAATVANPLPANARIGKISNFDKRETKNPDGTCAVVSGYHFKPDPDGYCYDRTTSTHLHFELKAPVAELLPGQPVPATGVVAGFVHVEPYLALVLAYQRKLGGIVCPNP